MRNCLHPDEADELFGPARGCDEFEQRLLRFDGPDAASVNRPDDEMLYVLEGTGRATVGGEDVELAPGTALYVAAGTSMRVESADGLKTVSVVVRDPLPADRPYAVAAFDEVDEGVATAGRSFRLLAPCASATQFVGIIPPGRAPDHFHTYDEVVYVLHGTGALHIDGESALLRPGSCIHLPARLVHALENHGPGEMRVLGVFRPAGSPAEAYYPDGTPAAVPVA